MQRLSAIPGYLAGTWDVDQANSDVSFTVRYLGVTKVHGRFGGVAGEIVTGQTLRQSSVSATIEAASIATGFPGRDAYIQGEEVLAVAEHKELAFVSTGLRQAGTGYFADGNLTIRDVTRPVTLTLALGGFAKDPSGQAVIGISGSTTLERAAFGLAGKVPPAFVGEKIGIRLDIHAVLRS